MFRNLWSVLPAPLYIIIAKNVNYSLNNWAKLMDLIFIYRNAFCVSSA